MFTYNFPDHLYLPDSEAIISVKEAAATVAYDKVVAQIEKEAERRRNSEHRSVQESEGFYSDSIYGDPCREISRAIRRSDSDRNRTDPARSIGAPSSARLNKFALRLKHCIPLTFPLMCRNWPRYYSNDAISQCPLCPNMNGWRKSFSLNEPSEFHIEPRYLCMNRVRNKRLPHVFNGCGLKQHLSRDPN